MGRNRVAAALGRVEINVENTGGSAELQLANVAFVDIESGWAELLHQRPSVRADYAL